MRYQVSAQRQVDPLQIASPPTECRLCSQHDRSLDPAASAREKKGEAPTLSVCGKATEPGPYPALGAGINTKEEFFSIVANNTPGANQLEENSGA